MGPDTAPEAPALPLAAAATATVLLAPAAPARLCLTWLEGRPHPALREHSGR